MPASPLSREEYVRKLLDAYRRTPGTIGAVRRPDRLLAAQLHQRGVPLTAVENALVLGRGSPPAASRYRPAATHRALLGVLPPGDRGSAGTQGQRRLLSTRPPPASALPLRLTATPPTRGHAFGVG